MNKGKVVQIIGSTLDAEFPHGHLPDIVSIDPDRTLWTVGEFSCQLQCIPNHVYAREDPLAPDKRTHADGVATN